MYFVYMTLWDEETNTGKQIGDVMTKSQVENIKSLKRKSTAYYRDGDRWYEIQEMWVVEMEKAI